MRVARFGADTPNVTLDAFAAELYQSLAPLTVTDPDNEFALANFIGAIGSMFTGVEDLVRDTTGRPGWTSIMDPQAAPADALPWLAQLAGVKTPDGTPEAVTRALITDRPGMRRGTPAALMAAVAGTLTGAKLVILVERDPTPYEFIIITRTADTPDPAATERAIAAAKPAGLLGTHVVTDYQLYAEIADAFDDYDDMSVSFADYNALLEGGA